MKLAEKHRDKVDISDLHKAIRQIESRVVSNKCRAETNLVNIKKWNDGYLGTTEDK